MFKIILLTIVVFNCFVTAAIPAWTDEQLQTVYNFVTSSNNVVPKKLKEAASAMGIADVLKESNEHLKKRELTFELLERIPDNFDFSKFQQRSCPEASFIMYLAKLLEKKDSSAENIARARYGDDTINTPLGYYLGYIARRFNKEGSDQIAAGKYFEDFLNWHKNTKSPIAYLFQEKQLATAHLGYALGCQRNPDKTQFVEAHLLQAYKRNPLASTAGDLADWYKVLENPSEEAKYRALAGKGSAPINGIVAQVLLPSGRPIPVAHKSTTDPEDLERMRASGIGSKAHLDSLVKNDETFRNAFLQDTLLEQADHSKFLALSKDDKMKFISMEIAQIIKWQDPTKQQAALLRLNKRIPLIDLDVETAEELAEMFALMQSNCSNEIKTLKQILRNKITQYAVTGAPHFLTIAYTINLPGLGEEIAFLAAKKRSVHERPIGIATRIHTGTVTLNDLHVELLQNLKKFQKPPHNVLQILRLNGISETSELYKYWQLAWRNSWDKEQMQKWLAYYNEIKRIHEASLSQTVAASPAPKTQRTGKASDTSAFTESDSDEEKSLGINMSEIVAEAWRQTTSIPEEIKGSLSLVIEAGTSGSMSVAKLMQTNADKTETELARYRPHRTHSAVWQECNQERFILMLWHLHQLKK